MALTMSDEEKKAWEAVRGIGLYKKRADEALDRERLEQVKEAPVTSWEYGGRFGQAAEDAARYRGQAEQAQGREGVILDYAKANQDRGNALDARNHQMTMAGMMMRRAQGQTPSIAQAMADRQMGQAAAEQSSAAAGARGPAALALAQQGAAANTANMQSQISNNAQINAMQERRQAEQDAMGAYSAMRGQDYQGQGLSAQEAQAQGQLQAQQRAMNDQYSLGMTRNEMDVNTTQMQGQMNRENFKAGVVQAVQNNANANRAYEAAERDKMIGATVSAIGTGVGMYMNKTSDERAKVPLTWGTGTPAPRDEAYEARVAAAHQALQQHADDNAQANRGGGLGGIAVGGMEVLRQMDEEALGLIRAKERNNVKLTEAEERQRESLEYRERQNRKPADAGHKKGEAPEEKTKADPYATLAGGLSNIGNALMSSGRYAPQSNVDFQQQSVMRKMDSGMEMKQPLKFDSGMEMKRPITDSDERAKDPLPLYEPEGQKLQVSPEGRGYLARDPDPASGGASLSGPAKRYGMARHVERKAERAAEKAGKPKAKTKRLSDAELMRQAEAMLGGIREQSAAQLNAGPSVGRREEWPWPEYMTSDPEAKQAAFRDGVAYADKVGGSPEAKAELPSYMPRQATHIAARKLETSGLGKESSSPMIGSVTGPVGKAGTKNPAAVAAYERPESPMAAANRSLQAQPYAYKPEFTPPEQAPGEPNVGPMANRMAEDPVAATAVRKDPQSGMLSIDIPKYTKVLGGGLAEAQRQLDEQKLMIRSLMAERMRGRK